MLILSKKVYLYQGNSIWSNKSRSFYNYYIEFLRLNLEIFFLEQKNLFVLKEYNYIFVFFMVSKFFKKNKQKEISFLFTQKRSFFIFLKNFFQYYLDLNKVFFFRLRLRGLGYKVRRFSKSLLRFFMGVSNYYYFFLPNVIYLRKKKRHLILLSFDKVKLNIVFWNLFFLKKLNVYVRLKGLNGFVKPNFIRFIKKKYKL